MGDVPRPGSALRPPPSLDHLFAKEIERCRIARHETASFRRIARRPHCRGRRLR